MIALSLCLSCRLLGTVEHGGIFSRIVDLQHFHAELELGYFFINVLLIGFHKYVNAVALAVNRQLLLSCIDNDLVLNPPSALILT